MASSEKSVVAENSKEWQQVEEEITCSICAELFTDPKTIPCLHTFCKRCIEQSIEMAVDCCPLCRAPLPQDGIASIPINFTINRLVEIFGKRKEAGNIRTTKIMCGTCEDGLVAVTWCIDCENSLCQNCNKVHNKWKAFKSHKTVTIKEFIQNPKLVLSTSQKPESCKNHSQQPLNLYCKTCSTLICRDCTLKAHPRETHDFDFIDEILDEERKKITGIIDSLTHSLDKVRNVIQKIEDGEKQIDLENKANTRKIQEAYGRLYKVLKQQQQEALQKVNTITMSLKNTLAMHKEKARQIETQLVTCKEFSNNIILTNQTPQLLTCANSVINRGQELTKLVGPVSIEPELRKDNMIVTCTKLDELSSRSLCHVSGLPYLPQCSVRGPPGNIHPVKITVTLRDIVGTCVVKQSSNLEMCCNKEGGFLQDVRIEEQSNGLYHIWYVPKRKESHFLSVYWRGLLVNREEVRVPVNIRDYANIKQEVKKIDEYGPNNNQLYLPYLLAKGPNNEIIVRNHSTHQLVIFDEQLQYLFEICGNGSGYKQFQSISGIAVDSERYLYVADRDLHCIVKLNLNAELVAKFGAKGTGDGHFISPSGLLLSEQGLLFVCDRDNHRIQVFKNEKFFYCFGKHGKVPGALSRPVDITMNKSDDQLLFIAEYDSHRIQVFTPTGQFLRVFGNFSDILQNPSGIHHTSDYHLLISAYGSDCVFVYEEDGTFVSTIEATYQGKVRFSKPCGIMMMNNGQIVIASNGTHKLVVF